MKETEKLEQIALFGFLNEISKKIIHQTLALQIAITKIFPIKNLKHASHS
jgi:hypothetical protein